jgi:hypothetical protein
MCLEAPKHAHNTYSYILVSERTSEYRIFQFFNRYIRLLTVNVNGKGYDYYSEPVKHRRCLRVASGATAPGPALEGAPRFRPKVVHKQENFL